MVISDFQKLKNKRKYLRRKSMYPSHLARTGHRWKMGKDVHGNFTYLCAVCGEVRVIRSCSYER